jgi:uncharacterized protein YbjT (DUF2867 family)
LGAPSVTIAAGAAGRHGKSPARREHGEAGDGIELVTGDLATGEGIDAAVDGVESIVHLAGSAKGDEDKARNLVRATSRAGAQHLVYATASACVVHDAAGPSVPAEQEEFAVPAGVRS